MDRFAKALKLTSFYASHRMFIGLRYTLLVVGNCPALIKLIKEHKVQAWNLPLGMGEISYTDHTSLVSRIEADRKALIICSVPHDQRCCSWAAWTHVPHRSRNIRVSHAAHS